MEELIVTRRGVELIPLGAHYEERLRTLPQGVALKARITQPRSLPHHNFFFAFLEEVYGSWPQVHKFQPVNATHLRAWLLVKVGYARRQEIQIGDASLHTVQAIVSGLRDFHDSEDRYYWYWIEGERLLMARPLSMGFDHLDQHDFAPISDAVFKVIYDETGMDADEHHERWKAANDRSVKGDGGAKEKKSQRKRS